MPVPKMQSVMQEITEAFAHVCLDSQEIPTLEGAIHVRITLRQFKVLANANNVLCLVPRPVPEDNSCKQDGDCPSKMACFNGDCENPCLRIEPCAPNAACTVHDDLPLRTMVCVCEPGFTGKGDLQCDPIGRKVESSKLTDINQRSAF